MDESPYDDRKLEVLRASCTGQPREMVNLFCVPMKNVSTSTRIEKALDRLRQRYGVSGGLTSEPKIIAIRNGPKVLSDLNSLKMYNEDLNTLEIFAMAHDEAEKLSGQLFLDTASRLPHVLKQRYLDYLNKKGLDLNRPGFESLRDFVGNEIKTNASDCAQAFFKSESKEGQMSRSKNYQVRQVTFGTGVAKNWASVNPTNTTIASEKKTNASEKTSNYKRFKDKLPPSCFVCDRLEVKHFLADCEKFKTYSPRVKRQTVMDAKRCLNCLSVEHFVRDCPYPSKCRKCGSGCQNKHSGALRECYNGKSLGAAELTVETESFSPGNTSGQNLTVHKIKSAENRSILLRTTAVKVANPATGKSTVAYAQLDTASQATLISDSLKNELGLKIKTDHSVTLRTLADKTVPIQGRANFNLESLSTGEQFKIDNALVVPQFSDDENILPHAVDVSGPEHFIGCIFRLLRSGGAWMF